MSHPLRINNLVGNLRSIEKTALSLQFGNWFCWFWWLYFRLFGFCFLWFSLITKRLSINKISTRNYNRRLQQKDETNFRLHIRFSIHPFNGGRWRWRCIGITYITQRILILILIFIFIIVRCFTGLFGGLITMCTNFRT